MLRHQGLERRCAEPSIDGPCESDVFVRTIEPTVVGGGLRGVTEWRSRSDRAGVAQRGDVVPRETRFEEDLLGVLAELGGDLARARRRVAEPNG